MRLDVQAIEDAFSKTGMKPIRKSFGDGSVGCGMQAYARAHEDIYKGHPANVSLLGVGRPYFEGFTTGWDGHSALPDERVLTQYGGPEGAMRYHDGLEDGAKAAEALFAHELIPA
jgi:hypothetical protein